MSGPFKLYIGAKLLRAFPESRGGVEPGYALIYPDGYRSWSPKTTFEQAYREVTESEKELACVQEVRVNDPAANTAVDTSVWERSAAKMSEP